MDRYTPKLGCQQKRDAAWTDITQNRVVSKNVREEEQVRKTERNFRVFRFAIFMNVWVSSQPSVYYTHVRRAEPKTV